MSETYNSASKAKHNLATLRGVDVIVPLGQCVDDSSGSIAFRAALSAPTTAPTSADKGSGSGPDGTYYYYATWYDENTDQESNPSPISSGTTVSDNEITVTLSGIGTTPASATHIRIYRNQDGGTVYRRITTVTAVTTTYDDDATDASIAVNAQLEVDNDALPALDLIERNGARLFGAKASALYWCKASRPENWPAINALQIARSNGYDIKALKTSGESLMIYKELGVHLFEYDVNPLVDGWVKEIDPTRGALNQRCVVAVGADHVVMDREGVFVLRGLNIIDLSEPIMPLLKRRNMTLKEWFCGEGDEQRIRFHVALDDDSTVNYALELDYRALQESNYSLAIWTLLHFDQDTRDASRITFSTKAGSSGGTEEVNGLEGKSEALSMTSDSLAWVDDVLSADGVPSWLECSGTAATATNGSSRTQITKADVAPHFQDSTISQDLVGCYLRFYKDKDWTRAYRIYSVTDNNTLDLAEEVDGTVGDYAGLSFIVGGVHQRFDTPIHDFGQPDAFKRLGNVLVRFKPIPKARGLDLYANLDHRGFSVHGQTRDRDGKDSTKNESRSVLSFGGSPETEGGSGVLQVPISAEHCRVAQFRFEGFLPRARVVFHEFRVNAQAEVHYGG